MPARGRRPACRRRAFGALATRRAPLIQSQRWFPANETLRGPAYHKLVPPLVAKIREEVYAWRQQGYPGASATSVSLLHWWFDTDHLLEQADGSLSPFRYYFAQREAVETLIWLADRRLVRIQFAVKAGVVLVAGGAVLAVGAYWAAPSLGMTGFRAALGAAVAWVALWIPLTHGIGQKREAVQEWRVHVLLGQWRGWMWTGAGAVLLSVASDRISDTIKSILGW